MKCNSAVELVYEEHGCGNSGRMCGVLVRERLLISCYANQEIRERQDAFRAFCEDGSAETGAERAAMVAQR